MSMSVLFIHVNRIILQMRRLRCRGDKVTAAESLLFHDVVGAKVPCQICERPLEYLSWCWKGLSAPWKRKSVVTTTVQMCVLPESQG